MSQSSVQGRFDRATQRRSWTRLFVALAVVGLVLAGLAAVAAAKDKPGGPIPVDVAATYSVTAPLGAGPQTVPLLVVGDVTFSAQCEAATNETPGYPFGVGIGGGWTVTNNGDNPVAFVDEPGTAFADSTQHTEWLAKDESFGGAGEWVNETVPDGNASWQSFAILDHGGASATGVFAWSARVNGGLAEVDGDEFGECVFTIQAKG